MRSTCDPIKGLMCIVKFTRFSQIPAYEYSTGETYCDTSFAYLTGFNYKGRLPAAGIYSNEVVTCLVCLGRECSIEA